MIKRILLALTVFAVPFVALAQEEKDEDETKMVREIVSVMVDKAKFAPKPAATPAPAEEHGKKGKKKHHTEEEVTPAPADTGATTITAPSGEIAKRAGNWLNSKNKKYTKSNVANTGSTISCLASFDYKQKSLNPENDVDGKITMDVIIDAKEGKYRYTVKNVKHVANKDGMSGGSIYEKVPACGSMKLNDQTWKWIKSASYGDIQVVVDDLKNQMKLDGDAKKKEDW
ncbi:MAG: hypothetical protein ACXVNR_11030 [Bacteroidia bacterium]